MFFDCLCTLCTGIAHKMGTSKSYRIYGFLTTSATSDGQTLATHYSIALESVSVQFDL